MAESHTKDTKRHQRRIEGYSVIFVNRSDRCVKSTPEDREQREKQAEHDAQNDAGNDGKIERGMFAFDPNVARQSTQPFRREAAPHYQTYQRGDHADDYDELSKLAHLSKSCANQPEAQA